MGIAHDENSSYTCLWAAGPGDIPRKAKVARNNNHTNAPRPADALIQSVAVLKYFGKKLRGKPRVETEASLARTAQVQSHQMTVRDSRPLGNFSVSTTRGGGVEGTGTGPAHSSNTAMREGGGNPARSTTVGLAKPEGVGWWRLTGEPSSCRLRVGKAGRQLGRRSIRASR